MQTGEVLSLPLEENYFILENRELEDASRFLVQSFEATLPFVSVLDQRL